MTWDDEMIWCEGCGVEFTGGGVVVEKRTYCCQDCARGILCPCGDRMEMDEERRNATSASVPTSGYTA
jgi:hypothetical protein